MSSANIDSTQTQETEHNWKYLLIQTFTYVHVVLRHSPYITEYIDFDLLTSSKYRFIETFQHNSNMDLNTK